MLPNPIMPMPVAIPNSLVTMLSSHPHHAPRRKHRFIELSKQSDHDNPTRFSPLSDRRHFGMICRRRHHLDDEKQKRRDERREKRRKRWQTFKRTLPDAIELA